MLEVERTAQRGRIESGLDERDISFRRYRGDTLLRNSTKSDGSCFRESGAVASTSSAVSTGRRQTDVLSLRSTPGTS